MNKKIAPIGESEMKATEVFFSVAIAINMIFILVGMVTISVFGKANIGVMILGFGFLGLTITTTANYVISFLRPFKADEK